MGDSFKKVQAGQPLEVPASVWNALLDVARHAKQSQHDQAELARTNRRQTSYALVRNQSGVDLDRFAVIELGWPIIAPSDNELEFKNRPSFQASLPSDSTGSRFGVTIEPIASGAIGIAAVAGVTPVKLAAASALYACAQPIAGATNMQSVPHGPASLLWAESTAGNCWAVIRIDQSNLEEIVLVTSNIPDEQGFYPGIVQRYDIASGTWGSQFPCKVLDANR